MRKLTVALGKRSYPILIGARLLGRAGQELVRLGFHTPPIVVADARVMRSHGRALLASLEGAFGDVRVLRIPGGEGSKSVETLLRIFRALLRHRAHRGSWLISFGGGTVGDVAGFAAATFLRGIPYVQIPTTLLAQVDSAVGGKVAINLAQGKNLVGAFHQPRAVISDVEVLRTLPRDEFRAGLYEVIKAGAVGSPALVRLLEHELEDMLDGRPGPLERVVVESCRIKARVVARDERERDLRMILNFGHTVGHALEGAADYRRFRHGEAVAWGMLAALEYGTTAGVTGDRTSRRLAGLIRRAGRLPALKPLQFVRMWKCLERDKKAQGGCIRMVLLSRLGAPVIVREPEPNRLRRFLKAFWAAQS